MSDTQITALLRDIISLQLTTIYLIATATVIGMAIVLILGLSLRQIAQTTAEIARTTTHIAEMTAHIAELTAQVLRDVRGE